MATTDLRLLTPFIFGDDGVSGRAEDKTHHGKQDQGENAARKSDIDGVPNAKSGDCRDGKCQQTQTSAGDARKHERNIPVAS